MAKASSPVLFIILALGCGASASYPPPAQGESGGSGGAPLVDSATKPPPPRDAADQGPSDYGPAPGGGLVDAESPQPDGRAAPSACKFALCESFESYKEGDVPDPGLWTQLPTKATVGSTFAARGTKALHIPPINRGKVQLRETKTFPALAKAFYARVFLYVDKQPMDPPPLLWHWTMIEASETAQDTGRKVRLGGHIEKAVGPNNWLRFNYETSLPVSPHETGLSDETSVIDPKKWHCIQVYFSMPNSEARIWLDGVERPKLHWQDNKPGMFSFPAGISSLSIGWVEYYDPPTPWEVWLDEIAVDANPIGCDD
jgi:hypothetical protein